MPPVQLLRRHGEVDVGEAGEQRGERDRAFEPGERSAEAEVDAVAEGEVAIVGSLDVELVRLVEVLGVAVGCRERDDHLASRGDRHPSDRDVLGCVAERRVGDRCVVAHDLLDETGHERRDPPSRARADRGCAAARRRRCPRGSSSCRDPRRSAGAASTTARRDRASRLRHEPGSARSPGRHLDCVPSSRRVS